MSNLSELLPAGSSVKSSDFVAQGTLSSGLAVALRSDGKVEAIAQTNHVETLGNSASSGSGNKQYVVAAFDPSQNRFLIAYSEYGSNNYGKLVTASVSGSTLTFGNEYNYYSGAINSSVGLVYVPSISKCVLAYKDVNNKGRAGVVTISGSGDPTLSGGTSQFANYIYALRYDVCYDASSGNVFFAYTDGGGDLTGVVGSISGSTFTYGSTVVKANSGTSNYVRCATATGGQVAVVYARTNNITYTTIANISGTSLTWATSDVSTMTVDADSWDFCYDTTANKAVFFGANAGNNYYPAYRIGTISGTGTGASISWSGPTVIESNSRFLERIVYIPVSNSYAVWYRTGSNTYQVLGATLSGTTLSFPLASKVMTTVSNIYQVATAGNTTQSSDNVAAFVITLASGNTVRRMYGASFSPAYTSTNVTSFIGITDQAISSAATGKVVCKGGAITNGNLSLVTNSVYYVQDNGTISTSSTSTKAGTALSSTSLLITG